MMETGTFKLLIVDGSEHTTTLMSYWLRSEDLQLYIAENGANALARLSHICPDIAVINVDLPDMSGYDLCRRVKEESEDMLVLCVSELDGKSYRLRAEEMGADDYIETSAAQYLFISKVRSLIRVKQLSNQLHERYSELEAMNNIINKQLEMGVQIQRALIPEINTSLQGCTLLSRFYPAMGIGGDFYNVLPLSEDKFGIVMGDVSGHGIAAAFCTALINMMIKNLSITHPEPGLLFYYLNNELFAMFENSETPLYACVFYAVVDTVQRTVTYSNAGQSLPLHVNTNENSVKELDISGLPIGLMKDSTYSIKSIPYNPSDLMLLHTDGLQDVFYKEQPDEFTHRIIDLLSEMYMTEDMDDVLDAISNQFYDTTASSKERFEMDDVSMILCRFN